MTELVCRTDSSARLVYANVIECVESKGFFQVVPDRTVLYPGGGGQPADGGTIDGMKVLEVATRPDGAVVHVLEKPVSGTVRIEVDWATRLDFMQQHTAQHLVTALAGRDFGWKTIAFHLNQDRSDIEFELESIDPADLRRLEDTVNDVVIANLPVTVSFVSREQMQTMNVRSRLLPEGLQGPFRLVGIEGIDLNTCGGTHVSRTGEVQVVKVLGTERLTRGIRVFYAAGARVRRIMDVLQDREAEVGAVLTTGPADFMTSIAALQAGVRDAQGRNRVLRARLAGLIVGDLLRACEADGIAVHHEDEPDGDFLRQIAEMFRAASPEGMAFLTAGVTEGLFVLAGPAEKVSAAGPVAARVLDGRGGGRDGIFQGRARSLSLWSEAVRAIHENDG